MCRILLPTLALTVALSAVFYQIYVKPLTVLGGRKREIGAIGNANCKLDTSLQACAKMAWHEQSGLMYLACSATPQVRTMWLPSAGNLNKTGAGHDYLAVYDPSAGSTTRLPLVRFNEARGLSALGIDVVSSSENPSLLWVYAINNRPPAGNAWVYGADTVVEIFQGSVGEKKLKWIATVTDPLIGIAKDIVGLPDGKSFYITNDKKKGSFERGLDIILGRGATTVTYCHLDSKCTVVASGIASSQGIAKGRDRQLFVSSAFSSKITAFERQADNSLVLTDVIPVGGGSLQGLSLDNDGTIYVAELPRVFHALYKHLMNPKTKTPSTVRKITLNTDESSFYGDKYKVETIFEDIGDLGSGITTAVFDPVTRHLFMHGIAAPAFVDCAL